MRGMEGTCLILTDFPFLGLGGHYIIMFIVWNFLELSTSVYALGYECSAFNESLRKPLTRVYHKKLKPWVWLDGYDLSREGWSGVTRHRGEECPLVFKLQKTDSNVSLVEIYLEN